MATMSYKRRDRHSSKVSEKLDELVASARACLSSLTLRRLRDCPVDAKQIIAVNFATRAFNFYRGYIKYGKMNFRIYTKDNGIVIVIKHEW